MPLFTRARVFASVALAAILLVGGAASVSAYDGWSGSRGNGPARASSYINRDTGAATENPDVRLGSNCSRPDDDDTQQLSDPGTANRNVHNDACLFRSWDYQGSVSDFDGPATFQSSGVGVISACPDPDGAGPKVATLSADKLRCTQTGYQQKGTAGDFEFHARLNNTTTPGTQRVVFCYDPELNGCDDAQVKDEITITWVRDRAAVGDGRSDSGGDGWSR